MRLMKLSPCGKKLAAGFPESVPGVTVDRQCGSSQQALSFAAQGVVAGGYDIAIASGVESMSRIRIGSQTEVDGVPRDVAGPSCAGHFSGPLYHPDVDENAGSDSGEVGSSG